MPWPRRPFSCMTPNPVPFSLTDLAFVVSFQEYLSTLLVTVISYIAPALSALLVVWIIVQGTLVMRGDLDARRGLTQIVKVVLVYGIVSGTTIYTEFVQNWFLQTIPGWIEEVTDTSGNGLPLSLPATLDALLAIVQQDVEQASALIGSGNNIDASSVQMAKLVLYGTLWTVFALYEAANLVSSVLIAIGPIFIIGYLFESTKPIAQRFVGQLIYYGVLLLLVNIVASIVIKTEVSYVTTELIAISALTPIAGQISDIWDIDIFLLTGDFLIISMPAVAAAISGGFGASRGETSVGSLGSSGTVGGFGASRMSGGTGPRLSSPNAS